ncbi:MAG: hypothetical protein EOP88_21645 [Verrucomicrobiaceae bacterium]|nr:MAG: hypothetical protein EOP88_21645 [Verrucomicrobiaceae bacterium]
MESRTLPAVIKSASTRLPRVNPLILGAVLSAGFFSSCVSPYNPPPSTYEERDASARRLAEIENENFRYRDRERGSAARSGAYYIGDPAESVSGARPVW